MHRSSAICLFVLSALAIIPLTSVGRSDRSTDGDSPWAWSEIVPRPSKRWFPVFKDHAATEALGENDLVTTRRPAYRGWSYPVYAKGELFYFGGGHSGYPGNDVEVYDVTTNAWTQTRHPEVPPDGDPLYGSGGTSNVYVCQAGNRYCTPGEWQPYTIHGYGRQSYDYSTDRYVFTATGCYEVSRSADGVYECAAKRFGLVGFDISTGTFEMLTPKNAFRLNEGADLTQYDERLGGVIAYYGRSGRTEALLLSNRKARELPPIPVDISGGGAGHGGNQSVYVPELQRHLVATMPQGDRPQFDLWSVDFGAGRATKIQVPEDARRLVGKGGNWQMAYARGRVLVVQANPADGNLALLRWYDPQQDAWTPSFKAADSPAIPEHTAGPGRQRLWYDALNNRFLLMLPDRHDGRSVAELWVVGPA